MTRDQKVFIFKKETSTIVKYKKSLKKILHKVLSSIKILKLLQGLVGFGNLRFAYPTSELRKAEIHLTTIVAFFGLFSAVCFQMFPQIPSREDV